MPSHSHASLSDSSIAPAPALHLNFLGAAIEEITKKRRAQMNGDKALRKHYFFPRSHISMLIIVWPGSKLFIAMSVVSFRKISVTPVEKTLREYSWNKKHSLFAVISLLLSQVLRHYATIHSISHACTAAMSTLGMSETPSQESDSQPGISWRVSSFFAGCRRPIHLSLFKESGKDGHA